MFVSDIPFDQALTKPELLMLVKQANPQKTYRIDELARRHGVEVLRLPPYHPDLNPIELVWAHEKVIQPNTHV